ncbi:TetR family transcriptional regulator [Mycobacterium sp. CVI_P3]|uniref:TetR family transcriptional regulator n=1 Tax=Mycobacterium pinniadriaticum TaxID=2994102 RepID=UPI002248C646|nr:TetR family transcriptional regulator [Mycobacterium pinniadriaticum]MCX2929972.1 TetR family transcriptional regulator [Mycobacterium pinniadriaticum]
MGRPPSPLVTRESAGRMALTIIDKDGLEAFTLPRLAAQMGVSTPALYHHFADRNELLTLVAHLVVGEAVRPPRPKRRKDWQQWVLDSSLNLREAVLRHRNAAPILLQFPPRVLVGKRYDEAAEVLAWAGVPKALLIQILDGIETLAMGATLTAAVRQQALEPIFPGAEEGQLPSLAMALEHNDCDELQLYSEAILSFLDGVMHRHEAAQ